MWRLRSFILLHIICILLVAGFVFFSIFEFDLFDEEPLEEKYHVVDSVQYYNCHWLGQCDYVPEMYRVVKEFRYD